MANQVSKRLTVQVLKQLVSEPGVERLPDGTWKSPRGFIVAVVGQPAPGVVDVTLTSCVC